MTTPATAASYMQKAERALDEARLLLRGKATEGACNRAYYAMFDAAHAALRAAGIETTEIKTHHGLLAVFGKELALTKRIHGDLSKALNQVQRLRQIADYTAEPPEMEKAQWAVEQAEVFLEAVRATFMTKPPGGTP